MSVSSAGRGLRAGVCTSTTRPSNPYEGQMVYETDTDRTLFWNGSAWYPTWNVAWGVVSTTAGGTSGKGYRTQVNSQTISIGATADLTGSAMTFIAVPGRIYRYTVNGYAESTSVDGVCRIDIRDGADVLNRTHMNMSNPLGAGMLFAGAIITGSGSKTIKAVCRSELGDTVLGAYGWYALEDIGPA